MRARILYSSRRGSRGTSMSSTHTSPRSGSSRPTMCLIATDFPVPEYPMMTIVSPSTTSSVKPFSTCFGPKLLCTSTSRIIDTICDPNVARGKDVRRASRRGTCRAPRHAQGASDANSKRAAPVGAALLAGRAMETLRGEAAERAADVTFTEPLERTVAELANALAGDAEHRTDFFERVLAPALESEVQAKHLCVAWRKRAERLFNLIGEKAVHRLLFRIRHLVRHEAL